MSNVRLAFVVRISYFGSFEFSNLRLLHVNKTNIVVGISLSDAMGE